MATLKDIQEITECRIDFILAMTGDWSASLRSVNILNESCTITEGCVGWGATKREAALDMTHRLQGRRIVQYSACYKGGRREIQMPSKISGYRW